MKSRSSAHNREPVRERFSPPVAVAGIAVAFILLLVILLPDKTLKEMIAKEGAPSAVLIRYLEAALKKDPGDQLIRIRLAEALVDTGDSYRAVVLLNNAPPDSDGLELRRLKARYRALVAELSSGRSLDPAYRAAFLREFEKVLARLLAMGSTTAEQKRYVADCRRAGAVSSAMDLEKRLGLDGQAVVSTGPALTDTAEAALGRADYRESARLCFAAMVTAADIKERRAFFIQGIKTLQSGNLLVEALASADRNIDGLDKDRETLLFLTRLSLAAGNHERAQHYIRKALGMEGSQKRGGKG